LLTFTPPESSPSGQFWGIYALIGGVRVKGAGQILWKRAEFRWEIVPSRGTHNRESPMTVWAWGTRKSLLEAERRDGRPEQVVVRMKSYAEKQSEMFGKCNP